MSSKKKGMAYVPREERPEFLAVVASLPEREAFPALARQLVERFNDAVLAGDTACLDECHMQYEAMVFALNGGTFFGSAADESCAFYVLQRAAAAPVGQVPMWGQVGEFMIEVEGIRLLVRVDPKALANHVSGDLWAIDLDKPGISSTGYRSFHMTVHGGSGMTVDRAVRAVVLDILAGQGGPQMIAESNLKLAKAHKYPAWLVEALAGVKADGQMTMFADPAAVEKKEPLSGAERARRHRKKLKELKQVLASEGVRSITLSHTDRCVLSLGLLAHEDLDHRGPNWAQDKKPGFDALLTKLWPEGDRDRYLAEPNRSSYRPTAFLRGQLDDVRKENRNLREVLNQVVAEVSPDAAKAPSAEVFSALEVTDAALQEVWEGLPSDFARARTALGLLRLRNNQHAELARAVQILQGRLKAAGLNERLTDDAKEWYWNTSPLGDYRATSAPEYMERMAANERSKADQSGILAQEIEALKHEADQLTEERRRAFEAAQVFENRLRAAGLSTDYRKQPGE